MYMFIVKKNIKERSQRVKRVISYESSVLVIEPSLKTFLELNFAKLSYFNVYKVKTAFVSTFCVSVNLAHSCIY